MLDQLKSTKFGLVLTSVTIIGLILTLLVDVTKFQRFMIISLFLIIILLEIRWIVYVNAHQYDHKQKTREEALRQAMATNRTMSFMKTR